MERGDDGGTRAEDLASLAGTLRVCEMEMVLLKGPGPQAVVTSHLSSDAIFCTGELSFTFHGRFVLPTDWCLFGYIHHAADGSWCHGAELAEGTGFTVLPEGISEFVLCAGSRLSVVLVPLARLHSSLATIEPYQTDIPARSLALFKPTEAALARDLRGIFEAIRRILVCADASNNDEVQGALDADGALARHLSVALGSLPEDRPQPSRRRLTHYLLVQKAAEYMRANMRHEIYMDALCNAAGVSERALRYAFDDLMGVSPMRYLSLLRLSRACRNLAVSDANRRSVKSVALSCGLWDLSRFAENYRRTFGELPRDTLLRTPSVEVALPP